MILRRNTSEAGAGPCRLKKTPRVSTCTPRPSWLVSRTDRRGVCFRCCYDLRCSAPTKMLGLSKTKICWRKQYRGVSRIHHADPVRALISQSKRQFSSSRRSVREARWRDLVCPNKTELTLFDAERSEVRNAAIPGVSDQQTRSISKVQNYCS